MRNVVFAAPFPAETTVRFARAAAGLSDVRMLGLFQEAPRGDGAKVFEDVVTLADGLDPRQLTEGARLLEQRHGKIHRLLGILEPLQVPLAQARQALGIPGTNPTTADLFRDKARMKEELRRNGLPCARHRLLRGAADAEAFASVVGYPLVVKPPAGMACKATWRVGTPEELRAAMAAIGASPEQPALGEEFIRGKEHSFDTITINGEVRFHTISDYVPGPLEVVETPWIQWVTILPRVISGPELADARQLGLRVIKTLGLETGFTHMEWFRRDDGTLAVGEIAARPPGAHLVLANSYAHDVDLYRAWARAVVDEAFDGPFERRWSVGTAFLRGVGGGRVSRVSGVAAVNERVGGLVVDSRLPALGTPRSDSYEGDGYVIVRHPDVEVVKSAMKTVIETIKIEYN
jgi:formate-dependent phosphoribosylglycinamide formyltransferase (GAR transformylase)